MAGAAAPACGARLVGPEQASSSPTACKCRSSAGSKHETRRLRLCRTRDTPWSSRRTRMSTPSRPRTNREAVGALGAKGVGGTAAPPRARARRGRRAAARVERGVAGGRPGAHGAAGPRRNPALTRTREPGEIARRARERVHHRDHRRILRQRGGYRRRVPRVPVTAISPPSARVSSRSKRSGASSLCFSRYASAAWRAHQQQGASITRCSAGVASSREPHARRRGGVSRAVRLATSSRGRGGTPRAAASAAASAPPPSVTSSRRHRRRGDAHGAFGTTAAPCLRRRDAMTERADRRGEPLRFSDNPRLAGTGTERGDDTSRGPSPAADELTCDTRAAPPRGRVSRR